MSSHIMKNIFKTVLWISATAYCCIGCTKNDGGSRTELAVPEPELVSAKITKASFIWEAVPNAAAYEIAVGDIILTSTGTSTTVEGLYADTQYSMVIKALAPEGDRQWADSKWSTPVTFITSGKQALAAPVPVIQEVTPVSFTIDWNAVKNAGKYVYTIDNGQEAEVTAAPLVKEGLRYSTTYTVKIKAVPSEETSKGYNESTWSEIQVTTLERKVLDTPQLKPVGVLPTSFTVTWNAIEHAAEYVVSMDGAEKTVTEPTVSYDELTPLTEYTVQVYAKPSSADEGAYIKSATAEIKVTTKEGPSPDDKDGGLSDFEEEPIF